MLIIVDVNYAYYGIEVVNNQIVKAPPIAKWVIGKSLTEFKKWVKKEKGKDNNMLKTIYNNIKWFIQRGMRGYADCDVWNTDRYLAKLIANMTRDLRFNNKGLDKKLRTALEDIEGGFNVIDYYITIGGAANQKSYRIFKEVHRKSFELLSENFYRLWD